MATPAKCAPICLDPIVHKALKLRAVETSPSVFDPVNQAVREALAEDLAAFEERAAETVLSYDEMVKGLKKDGPDIGFFSKDLLERILLVFLI